MADQAFERAHELAPDSPAVLYEHARMYIQSGRRLKDARSFLVRCLALKTGPEDPPRADMLKLLRRLPGTSAANSRQTTPRQPVADIPETILPYSGLSA